MTQYNKITFTTLGETINLQVYLEDHAVCQNYCDLCLEKKELLCCVPLEEKQ